MMRICPKCGEYYADASLPFCLHEGMPLMNVDPGSPRWSEGTKVIGEKKNALRKQRRKVIWLRVLGGAMTMLITTMVVVTSVTVETTPARLLPELSASLSSLPSSSPSESSLPSVSPSPSPSPSSSLAPSPSPSPSASVFASPSPHYKISGRVMDASQPLSGVKIIIDGAKSGSTTTDANGNYTFGDLVAGGSYSLTPARAKVNFTPSNRSFNNLRKDGTADFAGLVQPDLYRINGRVIEAGQPLAGIKMIIEGSKATSTSTDANGNYTFNDLRAGGSYTITPKVKMNFSPPNRSFNNLTGDGSADFVVETKVYRISGRVMDASKPLGGIKIAIEGSRATSTTTDANGNYTFNALRAGGSYTITPRADINFTPTNRSFNNLTQDGSADFAGVVKRDPTDDKTDNETDDKTDKCTDDDRSREKNALLRQFSATWERGFKAEEPKIIAGSAPAGPVKPVEPRASLGPIEYVVIFTGCKPRVVTATYEWQVNWNVNGTIKTVSVRKRKMCERIVGGIWFCHSI